jgi:hypothetical protein
VLKLLELFDSEDPRERDYLKTILHRIYGGGGEGVAWGGGVLGCLTARRRACSGSPARERDYLKTMLHRI